MRYVVCAVMFVLLLTGCSAAAGVEHAVSSGLSALPSLPAAEGQMAPALTAEQARNIALDYLGLSEGQVTGLRTELETDDGVLQYDVQFDSGDWEYEFEIQAETGKILSFDKDKKYR